MPIPFMNDLADILLIGPTATQATLERRGSERALSGPPRMHIPHRVGDLTVSEARRQWAVPRSGGVCNDPCAGFTP